MTVRPPKAPGRDDAAAAMPPAAPPAAPSPTAGAPRPISSDALFGGASEVHIAHRGSLYRLKQTALGKLILTK
jgi:hemin uptake protein HemP